MVFEPASHLLWAAAAGLALSFFIERLMLPLPALSRPLSAWGVHVGLWLIAYGALVLLLGRPWFSAAAVSAFLLMLVLVNNAKVKALREPFVFQDYEYFTDAIRHPRLYIPFLGWFKFLCAAGGFLLAITIGLWGESVPAARFAWSGQFGAAVCILLSGVLLLFISTRHALPLSLDPNRDVRALGLLASLWRYWQESATFPLLASAFDAVRADASAQPLPHLVAVQSESFFDARRLYPGIRADVLAEFDRIRSRSLVQGKLKVPAWGANTVRTEFAFLSGMEEGALGVHRFNPYRAISAGWQAPSLAAFLKRLGYRTVCIHPYPASFYLRNRVYPRLGFDEFIDIRAFAGADHSGPYISDAAVADKIASVLDETQGPIFVFAITMENHGPLHLERVEVSDIEQLYNEAPPPGCEDLTIYLRHLRNADRMIQALTAHLEQCERPAGLCWFGDHVPIMPAVYDRLGVPTGEVDFLVWQNRSGERQAEQNLPAHLLSAAWLRAMGLVCPAGENAGP